MRRNRVLGIACLSIAAAGMVFAAEPAAETSLISFSSGALVVKEPASYADSWAAFWMIDEKSDSGWASPEGQLENHVVVIEMPEKSLVRRLEFDTAGIDGDGRGARDVIVEVSDAGPDAGFKPIATVTLADRKDRQSFPASADAPGRWLRLTIKGNHGDAEYTELMDVRAYGVQLTRTPLPDVSGTYATNYNDFHIRQQGSSLTGCYDYDEGVLVGGIENRVMKLTWRERDGRGPAVMVFSPDGQRFTGLWWHEGQSGAGSEWNGTKKSKTVGKCPHWAGGIQEQMARDLAQSGRVRLYGINFEVDSAGVRDESKATLDLVVAMLKAQPEWTLTIEGHTDGTGALTHNQELSQRRAESVKAYLVAAGIPAARLRAAGFGASKPVASNATELGRAQNRRVELVKGE